MKTLNDYIESSPEAFRQEELILEVTELIARVMKQNDVNKSELASKLGKSKPHITQCLSGEQNLTLRTVADVFGALGYRLQVGAAPLSSEASKPVSRLYPIGGWSFEKACVSKSSRPVSCIAASADPNNDSFELQEAAA